MNRDQFEQKRPLTCYFGPVRCTIVPPHRCLLEHEAGGEEQIRYTVARIEDCPYYASDNPTDKETRQGMEQ